MYIAYGVLRLFNISIRYRIEGKVFQMGPRRQTPDHGLCPFTQISTPVPPSPSQTYGVWSGESSRYVVVGFDGVYSTS